MSREIEIEGQIVKVITASDIAPNGIEELRELCKGAKPSKTSFWRAPTRPAHPDDFLPPWADRATR